MIPMIYNYSIMQGLIYALIFNGYIFFIMITFSPRIWGYQDYSEEIKAKVQPQTRQERQIAILISIPFFLVIFGLPVYSLLILKAQLRAREDYKDFSHHHKGHALAARAPIHSP